MFFPLLLKVFKNIFDIYELSKIYNKIPKYCRTLALTVIVYQVNSMPHLHLAFELYPFLENRSYWAKDPFRTKLNKTS